MRILDLQWDYSFFLLQEVAASPADVAARVVAVEEGKNVAATFSRTSEVLSQLKTGAKSHAQQEIDTVNILTKEILNVNSKLLSSSTQGWSRKCSIRQQRPFN